MDCMEPHIYYPLYILEQLLMYMDDDDKVDSRFHCALLINGNLLGIFFCTIHFPCMKHQDLLLHTVRAPYI